MEEITVKRLPAPKVVVKESTISVVITAKIMRGDQIIGHESDTILVEK